MALGYKLEVVSASAVRDLTLTATVKAELGITDGTQDANIKRLISTMSGVAEQWCDRVFAKETVKESFRIASAQNAELPLIVERRPIRSVSALVENGVALTAADYEFDDRGGRIWRLNGADQRSWWACDRIDVTYVAGYSLLQELPQSVERAVILLVKAGFFKLTRDPLIRAESVPGVWDVTYWVGELAAGNDPDQIVNLLNEFRTRRI